MKDIEKEKKKNVFFCCVGGDGAGILINYMFFG
jgi:hypothetical protein